MGAESKSGVVRNGKRSKKATAAANGAAPARATPASTVMNGHTKKSTAPTPSTANEYKWASEDDEHDGNDVAEDIAPQDGGEKKKKKKKRNKKKAKVVEEETAEDSEQEADGEVPSADEDEADEPSPVSYSTSAPQPSSRSHGRSNKRVAHSTHPASTYDPSRYPRAIPASTPHPRVPFWTALSTYFAYGLLIAIGHCRDFLNKIGLMRTPRSSPQKRTTKTGMAPLVSDFEDFYTRRLYHRIESAWNRPIGSCPASTMTLLHRSRARYGESLELNGRSENVINLGSYNYLGFGDPNSPTKQAVIQALEQFGVSTSSSRIHLGTTRLHAELEDLCAEFLGKEAAMIFGMGFGTNSTGIPGLVGKGGLIISDSMNHSSIACGARSSGATIRVFKHNDVQSLEAVLRHAIISGQPKSHRPWKKILILIEGIYSMEGEICPLPQIVALKKKYGAYLFVDEAHSIGALGPNGRGVCEWSGVDPRDVDVLMGTFTKSFGAVGGYIAADRDVIEYLRANSAGSVYSASISPPAVQQVISAFNIIMHRDGTRIGRTKLDSLRENSNYFRKRLMEMGCHILGDWDSPIVLLMLYHPAKIAAFSEECLKRGLAVVVVGFPATPLLLARVRFCISAGHTREQLDWTLRQIEDVADEMGVKYAKPQRIK